jgi:hypothetical protein
VAEGLSPMIVERCFPAPRIVEDLSPCVKNAGRRAALAGALSMCLPAPTLRLSDPGAASLSFWARR